MPDTMASTTHAPVNFLTGVKVVDFTQFEAGPSCTEALAWFGADVVKIENPGLGDPGRRLRKGQPDDDPWYFWIFNANKKSIALNLKSERGKQIVHDLLKQADVCVENFAPGTIERLGLDYESVKKINPKIIYCQVKGFGEGSPFEKNLAFDMIAQAAGGTISVTGEADRAPSKPGISLGDTGTGMLMASTIIAALYKRMSTGEGARLQVAMQDAMLHYMRTNFSTQRRTGKPVARDGAKVPGVGNAPLGLYPCKPGGPNDYVYIMTSRANPEHWTRLLTLMGREDLVGDPRYATPKDRVEREAEVDELIAHWTRGYTKFEAMELVGGVGVPAGAVLDTMELMQDETFDQRGIVQTLHHPELGAYKVPAWPVRINGKPITVTNPPALGEHGADVLGKWLGVSAADAEVLKKEGIIG